MDELVGDLIEFVVEYGLDQLIGAESDPGVTDLAPVLAALEALNRQGQDMFAAISRPTQTAGEEMTERAVTAYSAGWHDDSLRDALNSIELYPYSARPRLVGGLSALALGRGGQGLELLVSAVKYSTNGQPEVGAVSALVAAHVAWAVGGVNLSQSVLQEADRVTDGRCPAVVGALGRHADVTAGARSRERLTALWWDEHAPAPLEYTQETFDRLLAALATVESGYLTAGDPFLSYLHDLDTKVRSAQTAFAALCAQLVIFKDSRQVSIDVSSVRRALAHTSLKLKFRFWDITVASVLEKCKSLPGNPPWPGDEIWRSLEPSSPAAAHELFTYARAGCHRLTEALRELPFLAEDQRLAFHDRTLISSAVPHLETWRTAIAAVQESADAQVADRAASTWKDLLAERERFSRTSQPVLHLDSVGAGLFELIGGLANPTPLSEDAVALGAEITSEPKIGVPCPNCHERIYGSGQARSAACLNCGQEILFVHCARTTGQVFLALPGWSNWTHPGCSILHSTD